MRNLTPLVLLVFALTSTGCADRIVTDDDFVMPDYARPGVELVVPLNNSVNVGPDEPITIWFDKLMNEESLMSLLEIWRNVPLNRIRSIAIDGSDILAARSNGGLFRSTDGGRSWLWLSEGFPRFNASELIESGGSLLALSNGTIWRSSDGGASFSESNSGLAGDGGNSIASAPGNSSIVYLTTEADGVYRSTDGGASWEPRSDGLRSGRPVIAVAVHPADPDIVFVTTDVDFIYRSEDGGGSWTRVRNGLSDRHFVSIAFAASDPNTLYAMSVGGTVYRSEDGGTNWTLTVLDAPEATGFVVAVSGTDANRVTAASSEGIFTSGNGGVSWAQLTTSTLDGDDVEIERVDALRILDDGALLAGTDAGILRGSSAGLVLVDDVIRDNLFIEGSMTFESWEDTTMVIALTDYHDALSADTSFINPYINERALAGWFARGKQGDPPVEAYPEATKVTFTPSRSLARDAGYLIRIPGTFEEDLQTYTGSRGVEDIHGNSKETHRTTSFGTEP